MLGGGVIVVLTLLGVATARSFVILLGTLIVFYPASGAFVSLTQAELMDIAPDRQAQIMARWDLAGSTGAVAGPLLVTAVLASGGGWRDAYFVLAGVVAVTWLGTFLRGPLGLAAATLVADGERGAAASQERGAEGGGERSAGPGDEGWAARAREVIAAARDGGVLRWLVLLQVADLLVDVFTGFLGLYLVDVAHLSPDVAALGIAIRLGAALAGDAVLVGVLERAGDRTVLRISAVGAALLYPGFLLVPGVVAKLVMLAGLSAVTAPWYPLLQARLYRSLPGRSSVAVTLSSAAGLAGGLGPLAVGLIAEAFGLAWALAGLVVVPVAVLLVSTRTGSSK